MSDRPLPDLPLAPPPQPRLRRAVPGWIERLLPVLFLLGGVVLLLRGERLTGLGALLLVPSALEGARRRPGAPPPLTLATGLVAAAGLAGLVLFVVGWIAD